MADDEIEGSDLTAIVADELRQAQTFDQSKRALAIQYMRGEMEDLPSRVNGSSQTSRDVADTLSWILPGVVRVFTASDQMVEFEATQEGGEQAAEEASEYTNYSFFRENDGYRILYNATYDSLLMGNGAACSYWSPEESKTKLFRDKTMEEIALLMQEEGWTETGVVKPGKPRLVLAEDPETGEDAEYEVPTLTVRLQQITERGQIRDMTCKPENLLLSASATTIEGARMVAYLHDDKTRSDLMEMADEYGWDTEVIKELPAHSRAPLNEVGTARQGDRYTNDASPTASGELIDLYEVYLKADADGDGVAELLRVWYAGNAGQGKVLSEDEWDDDVPFTDIPCYPVPHRWEAEGLYDRTADIARVKSTLLRQYIDNSYAVGLPMQEVEEGSVLNPDILVHPKFGGKIWKKKGSLPIVDHVIPFIGDKLMLGMQYMDEMITKRTGISKATMALDPEALQNQTATANQNQRDAGYSQIELVARNMAELGWAPFFAKRRNLAKKYLKGPVKIPSRNGDVTEGQEGQPGSTSKYRTIQPEAWGDEMACTINVGLGTGSRDRDMAMMSSIQNDQLLMSKMLAEAGLGVKALDFLPKIRKTAVQKAESAGLKNPDSYFPEVTDDEVEQMKAEAAKPKPDPAIALEQLKGANAEKLKGVDAQVAMHAAELKAQGDVVKNQAELDADLQTKQADRENAIALEHVTQGYEDRRFFAKLAQERELALANMSMAEEETTGEDGKPKKQIKAKSDLQVEALAAMISKLEESINAPTEFSFERDPKTNRVSKARKSRAAVN